MNMSSPAAGAIRALVRTPATAARYDLTSRAAVLCSVLALAAITGLDLIDGQLGVVFAVGFVLVVITAAAAVQENGLFVVGVMPPFLLVGMLLAVAVIAPESIVIAGLPETAGPLGITLAAAIDYAVTLLIGYTIALVIIVARIWGVNPRNQPAH